MIRKAIDFIKRLLGFEDESPEDPAVKRAEAWDSAAFQPDRDHRQILESTETRAKADAIRHAEEMQNRQFPVVDEARIMFGKRMADLRRAYEGGVAEVGVRIDLLEGELDLRNASLLDAEREETRFAAADRRPGRSVWPLGQRGEQAEEPSPRRPQRRESRRLRKARRDRADELRESERELIAARHELTLLPIEARNLAEKEMAFAEQVVSTYVSSAFSSMPAGSLQPGEGLAEQRPLDIEMPDWVPEREAAEEATGE